MMRSLYSGVSGLQNHQTRMDVVGNNIANVNTTGFKRGRVNFQDMISQNISGASRPTEERGGVNPKQVGLGMTVASIDTIHTQGAFQATNKNTDLAVKGNGFFVLRNGDNEVYTRAGAFGLDAEGNLVNPGNGMRVQGWMSERVAGQDVINTSADINDIVIPVGQKDPASATTDVYFSSNLDKRTPIIEEGVDELAQREGTWLVNKVVYDSFGQENLLEVRFTKTETPNQWTAITSVNGEDTDNFTIEFDNLGSLVSLNGAQVEAGTPLSIPVTFNVQEANEGDLATQTVNLNLGVTGSYTNSITQFADSSSTKIYSQNGYGMGYMEDFQIDDSGMISAVYSNGTRRTVGQIAMANFRNVGGLEKVGDTNFVNTNNSGDPLIGVAGSAGLGGMVAGVLEMSNVDLAEQFTDMIVTQRGFQANAKTITTADQLLQTLMDLKR